MATRILVGILAVLIAGVTAAGADARRPEPDGRGLATDARRPAPEAQERPVPSDSTRLTVSGCTRGVVFTVGDRLEHEPGRSDVPPGRRFRLAGSKTLLTEIRKHEGSRVQITGLVRTSQLADPAGINVGGGVRISPGPSPTAPNAGRDPNFNQVVFDLESWQPLPESCPTR
jgi:hypothetical protein